MPDFYTMDLFNRFVWTIYLLSRLAGRMIVFTIALTTLYKVVEFVHNRLI